MSTASALERQMLALINAERTSRGLNPVQLELRLNASAEDHSDWMLRADVFSHTGAGGSSAGDRMRDAGFQFSGSWTLAENIAWQSIRGAPGLEDDVRDLHTALMNSPGHRANILNENVTVIGIGIETGNFDGWDAIMVTQNFARTSAALQLDHGGSGENTSGGSTPTSYAAPVKKTVSGDKNGTNGDDWLVLKKGADGKLVGRDGDDILIGASKADKLYGSAGNDTLKGGSGNDKLHSGSGNDKASGGSGNDLVDGDGGNDKLYGGKGKDKLIGGTGSDWLHGGKDADKLQGGHDSDILIGSSGNDRLWGQGGDDNLKGGGGKDKLSGGSGNDILSGGSNEDLFIFSTGIDRVVDFSSADTIDLRKVSTITSYSDLRNNHMSQSDGDVVIEDGLGNSMIVEDTLIAELDRGDFFL